MESLGTVELGPSEVELRTNPVSLGARALKRSVRGLYSRLTLAETPRVE